MTQQHPITPPPELVRKWMERTEYDEDTWFYESYIAEQAAQWGADQELELCCKLLDDLGGNGEMIRRYRRSKPPSLKEQALEALMTADGPDYPTPMLYLRPDAASIIRRALEQLDD
jgi:hypothetical protein